MCQHSLPSSKQDAVPSNKLDTLRFNSKEATTVVASLELKRSVSSLLDGTASCLLEGSECRHMLFACFESKRSVSCLFERSEHRQPLFTSLESKQGLSSLLGEIVSSLLEGSEHRHMLPACFELN